MSLLHRLKDKVPGPIRDTVKRRLQPGILREGEVAPEWSLQDPTGAWHRHGDHWSLLVFYPGDDTPGCTAQLTELEAHRDELAAIDCRIYGVNPADAGSHRRFADKLGLGFPLLVDTDSAVAAQFHAVYTVPLLGERIIRTVYLVNPAGRVRLANRGAPAVAAILRSIVALQQVTADGM